MPVLTGEILFKLNSQASSTHNSFPYALSHKAPLPQDPAACGMCFAHQQTNDKFTFFAFPLKRHLP